MSCCGRWAACFSCPCDVVSGRRRGVCCLPHDVGRCDDVDSGGVVLSSWTCPPLASADVVRAVPCVLACLIAISLIHRFLVSLCGSFIPPSRLFRPASRVDERGGMSCLPRLSSSLSLAAFIRNRCHVRRAEIMDEMMSRLLLASFLSLSPDPLLPVLVGLTA